MTIAYLQSCPIDAAHTTTESSIKLPEGFLNRCMDCGQLYSNCTEEQYNDSMQEFNVEVGTLPSAKNAPRSFVMHKRRLQKAQRYCKKDIEHTRLLDLGCSSGNFLQSARRLGYHAEGVEPAAQAAKTAQQAGFTVHVGFLEELPLANESYDLITFFEVIEHLKKPNSILNRCHELLSKDGILMLSTGNGQSWSAKSLKEKWNYFNIHKHGGHISFYNPQSITALATRCGFKVLSLETRGLRFAEKGNSSAWFYKISKLASEPMSLFTRFFDKGHDMLVILQKIS